MFEILKAVFWMVYEVLLIISTIIVVLRCQSVWRVLKKIDADYTKVVVANDVSGSDMFYKRTKIDIHKALCKCQVSFVFWMMSLAFIVYEVIDCFVTYII